MVLLFHRDVICGLSSPLDELELLLLLFVTLSFLSELDSDLGLCLDDLFLSSLDLDLSPELDEWRLSAECLLSRLIGVEKIC